MKSFALVTALVFCSLSAFGQSTESVSQLPKPDAQKKPFFIGFDYMNLTDMKVESKFSYTDSYGDTHEGTGKNSQTTHIGVAGLRMGYSHMAPTGYGFNTGLRVVQTFNKSEAPEKVTMFIPEVNVQMALTPNLIPYVGLNISKFTGTKDFEELTPGFGLQAGLGLQVHKDFAVNAGYTLITQTLKRSIDEIDTKMEATFRIGGFSSNVTYLF